MVRLSYADMVRLIRAKVLVERRAHLISDFNQTLIREVGQRLTDFGRQAEITSHEWDAINFAVEAMSDLTPSSAAGDRSDPLEGPITAQMAALVEAEARP